MHFTKGDMHEAVRGRTKISPWCADPIVSSLNSGGRVVDDFVGISHPGAGILQVVGAFFADQLSREEQRGWVS